MLISYIKYPSTLFSVNDGQCTENVVFIPELVSTVAYCERILSASSGSLVFVGSAGFGRKLAVKIVTTRLGAKLMSPKMTVGYNANSFKADLKAVLQKAALENEQVLFLLEDFHLFDVEVIDLINSLLSSGEVSYTRKYLPNSSYSSGLFL